MEFWKSLQKAELKMFWWSGKGLGALYLMFIVLCVLLLIYLGAIPVAAVTQWLTAIATSS